MRFQISVHIFAQRKAGQLLPSY